MYRSMKLRLKVGTHGVNLRGFPPLAGLGAPVQENFFLSLAGQDRAKTVPLPLATEHKKNHDGSVRQSLSCLV